MCIRDSGKACRCEAPPCSSGITAFEPCRNITAVGAVFALGVSVGRELLPAIRAGKSINGFLLYGLRVSVPPCCPAPRAAELLLFPSGELDQRLAAVQAKLRGNLRKAVALCLLTGEAVGSTICFDAVL